MVDMVFVNNELSDTVTVGERAFINFEKRRAWQHACEGILSSRLKVRGGERGAGGRVDGCGQGQILRGRDGSNQETRNAASTPNLPSFKPADVSVWTVAGAATVPARTAVSGRQQRGPPAPVAAGGAADADRRRAAARAVASPDRRPGLPLQPSALCLIIVPGSIFIFRCRDLTERGPGGTRLEAGRSADMIVQPRGDRGVVALEPAVVGADALQGLLEGAVDRRDLLRVARRSHMPRAPCSGSEPSDKRGRA